MKGQADLAAPAAAVTATTVSVYFHVITSGSTGNVSDAQINQQLNVLSSAFAGSGFGFTLAGVTRTNNPSWFVMAPNSSAERNAKAALRQGDYGDLNIYSADPGSNLLGYATFPERRPRASTVQQDGIVVLHSSLPGGSAAPYDAGDTATHEAGHWFGLYHTFQGGCTKRGDLVDDTPAEAAPDYDCDESRDSCPGGGTDPVHNYMDYGDDACIDHFTAGQNARMSSIYASYRA